MKQVILIKYGELSTKKDNINLFLKSLKDNISAALEKENVKIVYDKGRMYVYYENNPKLIIEKLQTIFGIHEIALSYELSDTNLDNLQDAITKILSSKTLTTFKVETKRSNKNYPLTSLEISQKLGSYILEKYPNSIVDVHNPKDIIYVEVRKTNAYIYLDHFKGLGGYPIGTLGKGLLMLSGGLDSPVAGFLAMKRGIKIEAIYFDSPPHTSLEAKNKVIELTKILSQYQNKIKLHVIPFTAIQENIYKEVKEEYVITIMRRMMYRISEKIARKNNCKIIVNGESIGQVASQTLTSMNVINEVVKIPVIRPLACFDKLEIITLAKTIKTYETSILPYEDCCTIFVPKHPVINPDLNKAIQEENKIAYEQLINEAIKNEVIIRSDDTTDYSSYL